MYIPSAFAQTDADAIAAFVDRHPLATVIGLVDGRLDEAVPLQFQNYR